jgi:hypothetical protein
LWYASLTRAPDLLKRNFWFRLKLHRVRHSGLLPPLAILDPRLRQVQPVRHRHTRLFRGHRKADRYLAVILFANLAAILSGHSYRLMTLLGKACVIYHPRHDWITVQHGWDHKIQTAIQNRFVAPWGVRNQMVQRLVHPSHIVASQLGGHGFDAFPFAGQQQAGATVLQWKVTIGMPCGFRQALNICRKALFLRAWRGLFAHRTILHEIVIL